MSGDKIDQAVAAIDTPPAVTMVEAPIALGPPPTGRVAMLHVPTDITETEALEICAAVGRDLIPWLEANVRRGPRLIVPGRMA